LVHRPASAQPERKVEDQWDRDGFLLDLRKEKQAVLPELLAMFRGDHDDARLQESGVPHEPEELTDRFIGVAYP
jgi:hypothetical protein